VYGQNGILLLLEDNINIEDLVLGMILADYGDFKRCCGPESMPKPVVKDLSILGAESD
jgi:hypothetical protein